VFCRLIGSPCPPRPLLPPPTQGSGRRDGSDLKIAVAHALGQLERGGPEFLDNRLLVIAVNPGGTNFEFVRKYALSAFEFFRKYALSAFFAASGVKHAQHNQDQFRFCCAAFYSLLKSKVGNILVKATALGINLNVDGAPITSRTHTHPLTHTPLASSPLPSP
jgi:hypothetical protein